MHFTKIWYFAATQGIICFEFFDVNMRGCMKKTGVYLRVSTEEQRERHTIATQRRAAERYLQQQHGVQVQWYEDNG